MLTVEEEAKLRGESPIEVVEVGRLPPLLDYHPLITAWKPQSAAHQTMSSSSSSRARRIRNWDEKIFRPRDWSNTVMFDTGRDEVLHHCPSGDFRCSLMRGSVLGRNLKDRLVFGQKSGRMWGLERVGGVTAEEKLPPTSSKAGFVRPMRSACPTSSTRLLRRLFQLFSTLIAPSPLNLWRRIYNTTPLLLTFSLSGEKGEKENRGELCYRWCSFILQLTERFIRLCKYFNCKGQFCLIRFSW